MIFVVVGLLVWAIVWLKSARVRAEFDAGNAGGQRAIP